jgi:hypothetical protein
MSFVAELYPIQKRLGDIVREKLGFRTKPNDREGAGMMNYEIRGGRV